MQVLCHNAPNQNASRRIEPSVQIVLSENYSRHGAFFRTENLLLLHEMWLMSTRLRQSKNATRGSGECPSMDHTEGQDGTSLRVFFFWNVNVNHCCCAGGTITL